MNITFEFLNTSHFVWMLKWLQAPHVRLWWDPKVVWNLKEIEKKYTSYTQGYKLENGKAKEIHAYVIYVNNLPVGYIQMYDAYDFARTHPLIGLPKSLAALDVFIGEKNYLGRGISSEAIKIFLKEHCKKYNHVLVDPDSNNLRAIRAYEKAGFSRVTSRLIHDEIWMIQQVNAYSAHHQDSLVLATEKSGHFTWGNNYQGWWLKKGGNFNVILETMPPRASEIRHLHSQVEQFFYVLMGSLHIELADVVYRLEVEESLIIPQGLPHQVFNAAEEEVKFLVISAPNLPEDKINLKETSSVSLNLVNSLLKNSENDKNKL